MRRQRRLAHAKLMVGAVEVQLHDHLLRQHVHPSILDLLPDELAACFLYHGELVLVQGRAVVGAPGARPNRVLVVVREQLDERFFGIPRAEMGVTADDDQPVPGRGLELDLKVHLGNGPLKLYPGQGLLGQQWGLNFRSSLRDCLVTRKLDALGGRRGFASHSCRPRAGPSFAKDPCDDEKWCAKGQAGPHGMPHGGRRPLRGRNLRHQQRSRLARDVRALQDLFGREVALQPRQHFRQEHVGCRCQQQNCRKLSSAEGACRERGPPINSSW
mmetsp:Transcript_1871/g.4371  ORF Transcript_1871/g.4371 Transcript_1871/m.4371 type:complete len:272 (-) Transcript_1871:1371-2186(-)